MKNIYRLIALVFTVLLAACSQQSNIEKAVKENLRDSESAQFRDLIISPSGELACIVWNAKNGMGGYGDWELASLQKDDAGWRVDRMQTNPDSCTPEGIKLNDNVRISIKHYQNGGILRGESQ